MKNLFYILIILFLLTISCDAGIRRVSGMSRHVSFRRNTTSATQFSYQRNKAQYYNGYGNYDSFNNYKNTKNTRLTIAEESAKLASTIRQQKEIIRQQREIIKQQMEIMMQQDKIIRNQKIIK